MSRILERDQAAFLCGEWRQRGETVVMANGCFDVLHAGHVRYLQDAKAAGTRLVVAVNDDDSVRRLKGEGRPVMPLADRLEVIAALSCVDLVTSFGEDTAEATLRALKPHHQAKGTDYTPENVPEAAVLREWGGSVIITGDEKTRHSRELAARLKAGS